MPKWVRIALALIAGIFSGGTSIAVIEMLGHKFVAGQAVFIIAVIGLGVAAFLGGIFADWISKVSELAWVVSGLLALLSLINVFSFKHPTWFVPVALILLAWTAPSPFSLSASSARLGCACS